MKTIKKIFALLILILLIGMTNDAKAQDAHFDVDNQAASGCDWTITIYDASSVAVHSFTAFGNTHVAGCQSWSGGQMNYVTVDDGNGCVLTFLSSLGTIPYVNYVSPCSGATCSPRVDGSGSLTSSGCSVLGYMIIRIF